MSFHRLCGYFLVALCAVAVLGASAALADVFGTVDRSNGSDGDRAPVGPFDGDTDPLATEAGGLINGNMVFSDRTYPWKDTPGFMEGMEYIRTFNTDKDSDGNAVNYQVQILEQSDIFVTVDDRHGNQQAVVDAIVSDFANPGDFVDSGHNLTIDEGGGRAMSMFVANLSPGTYNFGPSQGQNFYTIGQAPEFPALQYQPIAFTYSTAAKGGTISGTIDARRVGGPENLVMTAAMPTPTIFDPNPVMTPGGSVGTITSQQGPHNEPPLETVGIDWDGLGPVTLTGTHGGVTYTVDVDLLFGPSGDSGYNNPGEDPNSSYDAERGPDYVYEWTIEISDDALPEHGGDACSPGGSDNPRMAVYLSQGREEANGGCHRFTQVERQFNVGPDAYTNTDGTTASTKWTKYAAYQPLGIYYGWRDRDNIGGGSFQIDSILFSGNLMVNTDLIVPEPATMAILALGGVGVLLRRRRR